MKLFEVEKETSLCIERKINSINLSKFGHIKITKELHRLMYDRKLQNKKLSVKYAQDTRSLDIPLGRLAIDCETPEYTSHFKQLTIGAMSLRHHEIDFFCDFYLALNSEISNRNLTGRDTHLKAYSATREKLYDLVFLGDPVWIRLVHTGLQPVICGIYHALEEIIFSCREAQKPQFELVVEPIIYKGKYEKSKIITPKTEGAKIEDYSSLALWF